MRGALSFSKLFALTVVVLGIAINVRAAIADDTLVCHGGGKMAVKLWHRGITLQFDKATNSAKTHAPMPGQCAPLDRPFLGEDPATLTYTSTRLDDVTIEFDAKGMITSFAVHGSHGAPAVLRTMLDGIRGQKTFRLNVKRLQCGGRPCPYFTVTATTN